MPASMPHGLDVSATGELRLYTCGALYQEQQVECSTKLPDNGTEAAH